jgi:hypothetical protein
VYVAGLKNAWLEPTIARRRAKLQKSVVEACRAVARLHIAHDPRMMRFLGYLSATDPAMILNVAKKAVKTMDDKLA